MLGGCDDQCPDCCVLSGLLLFFGFFSLGSFGGFGGLFVFGFFAAVESLYEGMPLAWRSIPECVDFVAECGEAHCASHLVIAEQVVGSLWTVAL